MCKPRPGCPWSGIERVQHRSGPIGHARPKFPQPSWLSGPHPFSIIKKERGPRARASFLGFLRPIQAGTPPLAPLRPAPPPLGAPRPVPRKLGFLAPSCLFPLSLNRSIEDPRFVTATAHGHWLRIPSALDRPRASTAPARPQISNRSGFLLSYCSFSRQTYVWC
jgi:hypothetical protein